MSIYPLESARGALGPTFQSKAKAKATLKYALNRLREPTDCGVPVPSEKGASHAHPYGSTKPRKPPPK